MSTRVCSWPVPGRTTVHEMVDGVGVTRVANLGFAGSVAVCPSQSLWLAREQADVIVIHEPNPMGLVAYALARPAARLIVWFHSEVVRDRWKYALMYRPWLAHAMRRASRVIVGSPPMADAEQLRGFHVRTEVIPYGVDQRRLERSPEVAARETRLRASHSGLLILFVGRLVPYKGLTVLLRAMVDVPATAVLVGDGPQREALEALARELGIASRVVFAGEVDETELTAWYHACDLFGTSVDYSRRGVRSGPDRGHGVWQAGGEHGAAVRGAVGQSGRRDGPRRSPGRCASSCGGTGSSRE